MLVHKSGESKIMGRFYTDTHVLYVR